MFTSADMSFPLSLIGIMAGNVFSRKFEDEEKIKCKKRDDRLPCLEIYKKIQGETAMLVGITEHLRPSGP